MIIAIEGIDASGKATQSRTLTEDMLLFGMDVQRLAFPAYETATGRLIRAMLQGDLGFHGLTSLYTPQAITLQSLMAANRYEHFNLLREASASLTHHLVLDRYWLSGLVYGVADGLDVDWLRSIHQGLPRADITLYLDIPVGESWKRRPARADRYEADRERLDKVRTGYLTCCETEMAVKVDGLGTVDEVNERIWAHVQSVFQR